MRTAAALLAALLVAAPARASPPTTVTGVQVQAPRGPAFWRLSRGPAEVWILAVPPVLPRGQTWDRRRLQGLLAGARALITPAAYALDHATSASARRRAGPARPLGERLAPELAARFAASAAALGLDPARYADGSALDAAYRFRADAQARLALTPYEPDDTVRRLARRAGVPVRPVATYRADLGTDPAVLSDASAGPCLDAAIRDVAYARDHAAAAGRAWSVGDVAALRAGSAEPGLLACLDAAPAFAALRARNLQDTVTALDAALSEPGRSVAILTLGALDRPGGVLDALRARGAVVTPPPGG